MQHEPRCPVSGAGEPRKGYYGVQVLSPVERSQLSVVLETARIACLVVAAAVAVAVAVAAVVVGAAAAATAATAATATRTTAVVAAFAIFTVSLVLLVESCRYRRGCSAATVSEVVATWQRERIAKGRGRGRFQDQGQDRAENLHQERQRERSNENDCVREEKAAVRAPQQEEEGSKVVDHRSHQQRRRRRRWHEERTVTPVLLSRSSLSRGLPFDVPTVAVTVAFAQFQLAVRAAIAPIFASRRDRREGRLLQGEF